MYITHHAAQRVIDRVPGAEKWCKGRATKWLRKQVAAALPVGFKTKSMERKFFDHAGERYVVLIRIDEIKGPRVVSLYTNDMNEMDTLTMKRWDHMGRAAREG